jgi:hypothetical protein
MAIKNDMIINDIRAGYRWNRNDEQNMPVHYVFEMDIIKRFMAIGLDPPRRLYVNKNCKGGSNPAVNTVVGRSAMCRPYSPMFELESDGGPSRLDMFSCF